MVILILDWLRNWLGDGLERLGPWRVLTYNPVRAAMALALAFTISLVIGPWVIRRLREIKAGQVIRHSKGVGAVDLAAMHGSKAGTPTMGGLLMMFSLFLPVILFCRLSCLYVWLLLAMTFGYGALGFWDDYLKIVKKNHYGVSPARKLIVQGALALVLGTTLTWGDWAGAVNYSVAPTSVGYPYLLLPVFKNVYYSMGWMFVPYVMVVLLATSNAVNLTDGLDGLAIGVSISSIIAFIAIGYVVSRFDYARHLFVPYIHDGNEIVVFLAALLGASLGFLWFNAHPAEVFMGDTGSMMLGGALGTSALLLKQEVLLIIIGGVFVMEAASVILQVGCYKLTRTRLFRMSPLHHHFEKAGIKESKIIVRFWVISWLLALAGMAMLKLR
ncbi:phospho-N-acetylmuramoyl-pentapeptide-transferase [bacterium]|nr:phospho-N-acetylmuramoyl-pentapeptide-transferase [bacterium]